MNAVCFQNMELHSDNFVVHIVTTELYNTLLAQLTPAETTWMCKKVDVYRLLNPPMETKKNALFMTGLFENVRIMVYFPSITS